MGREETSVLDQMANIEVLTRRVFGRHSHRVVDLFRETLRALKMLDHLRATSTSPANVIAISSLHCAGGRGRARQGRAEFGSGSSAARSRLVNCSVEDRRKAKTNGGRFVRSVGGLGGERPREIAITSMISCGSGGEGGIRTPDTVARMPHFECGAFNHSATSPEAQKRCDGVICERI